MQGLILRLRLLWQHVASRLHKEHSLIEEEKVSECAPERWYPVTIGETFLQQYKAIGKLGWGRTSTVWLCQDQR